MFEIIQIVGVALIAAFLALVLHEQKPVFALLLTLFTGAFIFLFLLDHIQAALSLIEKLAGQAGIHMVYLQTILKIIAIAYIAEFGSQIAKDAGQGTIAAKIELAGKVLIIVLAIPIFDALIETVLSLIPGS